MLIKDREFVPFIGEAEIAAIVQRVADEVSRDYSEVCRDGRGLLVCPVLTGAFLFGADLVRRLTVPAEVRFVKYASYEGMSSTGSVSCQLGFGPWVEGRDVLVVEDVVDTGLSMQRLLADVKELGARSVRVCTLLLKPGSFRGNYKVDYVGKEIGNEFIVGYGMDYDEQGRTLPEILVVSG